MKQASEYRRNADDCRTLATGMPPGAARDQLLRMAGAWEELARDREAQVSKQSAEDSRG